MALTRHERRPGLREVSALWALYAVVAAEVFATYARLPVGELYHVSGNGREGGAARVIVFANWPVALAAIPMVAVVAADARSRSVTRLAILAGFLCAGVFWPGMVDQSDLDATWANAIAATGVALAFALTVFVARRRGLGPRRRAPGDRARIAISAVLILLALPWLAADLGLVIGRWPLFGSVYFSDEWFAPFGRARVDRAVHAGHHHGMAGTLLVFTAVVLSRTLPTLGSRLRAFVGAYLALLALYGAALIANDFWYEQLVKRGVTHWEFPSLITPKASVEWLLLLLLAALLYALLLRSLAPGRPAGDRGPVVAAAAVPVVLALLTLGLVQSRDEHETRAGAADGIAFAAAPDGKWRIFVTRSDRTVQLTDGDGSDLAPAWSPDHRRLAFQSSRDGNWEIYVVNADGSGTRRLTHDDARDGEPGWSADGHEIVFTRNGDLHTVTVDGGGLRSLDNPGEWPTWSTSDAALASDVPYGDHYYGLAVSGLGREYHTAGPAFQRRPSWSPDGRRIALECRDGDHWRICTFDPRGAKRRYLSGRDSNAFAPAWSPDGKRIAFVSDRDGVDQLFVMDADGANVIRVTNGQGEKDTPTWSRR